MAIFATATRAQTMVATDLYFHSDCKGPVTVTGRVVNDQAVFPMKKGVTIFTFPSPSWVPLAVTYTYGNVALTSPDGGQRLTYVTPLISRVTVPAR